MALPNGKNPLAYEGVKASNPARVIVGSRDPNSNDVSFDIGTKWINKTTNKQFVLTSIVAAVPEWQISASITAASLEFADVTITSAQVKAIRATPITIAAAPAAGSVLVFSHALLKLNYGTNVFTETADNLAIRYTDGTGAIVSQAIESTGFIDQAADTYTNALAKIDGIVVNTGAEAQALVLHNTGDGEIAGNAAGDNTVTLRVYYTIASI